MKSVLLLAAAFCASSVMAAAVDAQAAAMAAMVMVANTENVKDLVSSKCPDLKGDCSDKLNDLLETLKNGAPSKDVSMIDSGASDFAKAIQSNPKCAAPIIQCIQAAEGAAVPSATAPSVAGVIREHHSSNQTRRALHMKNSRGEAVF